MAEAIHFAIHFGYRYNKVPTIVKPKCHTLRSANMKNEGFFLLSPPQRAIHLNWPFRDTRILDPPPPRPPPPPSFLYKFAGGRIIGLTKKSSNKLSFFFIWLHFLFYELFCQMKGLEDTDDRSFSTSIFKKFG